MTQRSRQSAGRSLPVKAAPDCPRAAALSTAGAVGRALLLIHLVLSPLVFSRFTVEPFESNKLAALLTTAILLGALGLCVLAGRWLSPSSGATFWTEAPRRLAGLAREPVGLGFLLFLFSAIVSTVSSVSPQTSFQGAHESPAGLLTVLGYTVVFFATRALCCSPDDGRRLLLAPVIGAAVASAYAAVQVVGADPLQWGNVAEVGG